MPSCKRIVVVLDSSGSMSSQKSDIVGGINEMIREQRKTKPEENANMFFNIVKFNDTVSEPIGSTLDRVPFITENDYRPSGTTALYDAMGKTMDRYRNEHDVIMIVATDGQENASKSYTYKLITDMVSQFKSDKGWNFIYLSEDIDTFKQGNSIGISHDAYACNNLAVGTGNIGSTMGSSFNQECISQMRMGNKNVKLKSASKYTSRPSQSSQQPAPYSGGLGWW